MRRRVLGIGGGGGMSGGGTGLGPVASHLVKQEGVLLVATLSIVLRD
jgi:hypothetical protein